MALRQPELEIASGEAGAAQALPTVPDAVARVRERDPLIRAFLYTRLDAALADHAARAAEAPRSPLHGLPFSLKDIWEVAGLPTTAGSWRHRDRIAAADSPVVSVFRDDAGAVLLGKTSLCDLALLAESDNYLRGPASNPRDLGRTAGGSSGGAAAAVADGMVAFEWGTDFGGSIRLPAAFCGITGLRLSTETWPVRGAFPVLPDPVGYMNGQGPLTRDLATMQQVLAVARPRLRTGPARPFKPRGALLWVPKGRYAGEWPTFAADAAPRLRRALGDVRPADGLPSAAEAHRAALGMWCAHFGALADAEKSLPLPEGVVAALSALVLRGRFGDRRMHPQTAEVLFLLLLGRVALFRDKRAARNAVTRLRDAVSSAWDDGWVIALPTCTFPAPRHGTSLRNFWLPGLTMPGNTVDATALALPFGQFADGLPRSIQLWGPPGSEDALIDAARKL